MTPEEERIRELQRRAANNDKEAQTMLALMSDRPEPDPRMGIQKRAQEAYALPEIDIDQQRANMQTDNATGTALGTKIYEDEDKWKGGGLLGLGLAGIMNQLPGQKAKKEERISTSSLGIRRAREAKRLAAEAAAARQANIAGFGAVNDYNEQSRDFGFKTSERQADERFTERGREDTQTHDMTKISQQNINENFADRTFFHDPSRPTDPHATISFRKNGEGRFIDEKNNLVDAAAMYTEYTAPNTGSRGSASLAKFNEELRREDLDVAAKDAVTQSNLGRLLMYPRLEKITGTLDPQRKIADILPLSEATEEDQAMLLNMRGISLNSIAPVLDIMGVNPTDVDLVEAFKTGATENQSPKAWIQYVRNNIAPLARSRAYIGMQNTGKSKEEIDAAYDALIQLTEDAEKLHYGEKKRPRIRLIGPAN